MRKTTAILAGLLLALLRAPIAYAEEDATGALPAQDAGRALVSSVEEAWNADSGIPGFLLAAKLRDGKLQLFGAVESAEQRSTAVAIAKNLAGDTPVVDHIEVTRITSLESTPEVGAGPAAVPPQDVPAALTSTIEQAWIQDGQVPYPLLAAKVRGGKLQLFGTVETQAQHEKAVAIAKQNAGAVPVVDHIAVKKVASLEQGR